MSAPDRRALPDHDHGKLSMGRQCALLGVARSGVYRQRRPANNNDLAMVRRLDELFTALPFLGSRRMAAMLRAEGHRGTRTKATDDETCGGQARRFSAPRRRRS